MSERGIVCMFCGKGWGYVGEEPKEEDIKSACDHEAKCDKNPYLQEIARLRKAIQTHREVVQGAKGGSCVAQCEKADHTLWKALEEK